MSSVKLLNHRDPDPVLRTAVGVTASPFLMIGDHGGAAIPEALGDLGLPAEELRRHIALDLGVEALGKALSARLDAPFLWQVYSRLVCDCNRNPDDPAWMADVSDGTAVPGNQGVSAAERTARRKEIFDPYHRAIGQALDDRAAAGVDTVLLSLHSFTPEMAGARRPWELGVLHDGREDDFALRVLSWLQDNSRRVIGDNEPYALCEVDYTVPHHAYSRGLRYLELEVRQDILCDTRFDAIVDLLAECFPACL